MIHQHSEILWRDISFLSLCGVRPYVLYRMAFQPLSNNISEIHERKFFDSNIQFFAYIWEVIFEQGISFIYFNSTGYVCAFRFCP